MRKLLSILLISVLLFSCERLEYEEECCPKLKRNIPEHDGIRYASDAFHADVLIGHWRCDDINIGATGLVIYEITFSEDGKCDIVQGALYDSFTSTMTYKYRLNGRNISFMNSQFKFEFRIENYIWPSLFLSDSFGKYEIRKDGYAKL